MSRSLEKYSKPFDVFLVDINQEIENRIVGINPSDFIIFPKDYHKLKTLEGYKEERDEFYKQFEYKKCLQEPYFFSDYIRDKINNENLPSSRQNFIDFLKKFRGEIESERIIMNNRIKSSNGVQNSYISFSEFQKQISEFDYTINKIIMKLESTEDNLTDADIQLLRDMERLRFERFYPLNSFYQIFKLFPFTHKKTILTYATSLLKEHKTKENEEILPQKLTTSDEFLSELKRLSKELHIDFDIDDHDGHHYFYSCDTQFSEVLRKEILPTVVEPNPSLTETADFHEIISDFELENAQTNLLIVRKLVEILNNNVEEILDQYSDERFQMMKTIEIREEILSCWQKLSFVRNRKLLTMIMDKLILINERKQQIFKNCTLQPLTDYEDEENIRPGTSSTRVIEYVSIPGFAAFRRQFILILSKILTDNPSLNLDYMFEITLIHELNYLIAKANLMHIYLVISQHSISPLVLSIANKLFESRPDISLFISGKQKSAKTAFLIETEKLTSIAKAFSTFISLQTQHELFIQKVQQQKTFVGENFIVMTDLENLAFFIRDEEKINADICHSMFVNTHLYKDYVSIGIWKELEHFTKTFRTYTNYPFPLLQTDLIHIPLDNTKDGTDALAQQVLNHHQRIEIIKTTDLLPFYNSQCSMNNRETIDELVKDSYHSQMVFNCQLKSCIMYNNYASDGEFIRTFGDTDFFYYSLPPSSHFSTIVDKIQLREQGLQFRVHEPPPREKKGETEQNNGNITLNQNLDDKKPNEEAKKSLAETYYPNTIMTAMRCDFCFLMVLQIEFIHQNHESTSLKPTKFFDDQVNPFAQLTLDECLSIKTTRDLLEICLIRTRLMFLSRFEFSTSFRREKCFEMLATNTFNNSSSYIIHLITELQSMDTSNSKLVLDFLKECEDIEILRLLTALIYFIINNIEKPPPVIEKIVGRRIQSKLSQVEAPLKQLYAAIQGKDLHMEEKWNNINRYIPLWLRQMLYFAGDNARSAFHESIKKIDDLISDALVHSKLKGEYESPLPYLKTLYTRYLLHVVFNEVSNEKSFKNIDPISCIETFCQKDYELGKFYQDKFTKTTFVDIGKIEDTKIGENQAEIKKYHVYIDDFIMPEQESLVIDQYEKMHDAMTKIMNSNTPSLKPDIYSKKKVEGRRNEVYLPDPVDLSHQFAIEMRYDISRIIQNVCENIQVSHIDETTINIEKLKTLLERTTNEIENEISLSRKILYQTWPSTITSALSLFDQNNDIIHLLDFYLQKLAADAEYSSNIEIQMHLAPQIYELNSLQDKYRRSVREYRIFNREKERETRNYFDQVLTDISIEINNRKSHFGSVHDSFFASALDNLADLMTGEERVKEVVKTHKYKEKPADPIQACKEEIEELRKEVLMNRVENCLRQIAIKKRFERKRDELLKDRLDYNQIYWGGKHRFDEMMHGLQSEVDEGTKTLVEKEEKIEALKNELHLVVRENTMLDHIRQMTTTKARDVTEALKPLIDVQEDYIYDILVKLENATNELEELKVDDEENEEFIETEIRQPLDEISRLRGLIMTTKIEEMQMRPATTPSLATNQNSRIKSRRVNRHLMSDLEIPVKEGSTADEIINENKQLKEMNAKLKTQISFILTQIKEQEESQKVVPNLDLPFQKIPQTAYGRRKAYNSARRTNSKKIVKPQTVNSARNQRN